MSHGAVEIQPINGRQRFYIIRFVSISLSALIVLIDYS